MQELGVLLVSPGNNRIAWDLKNGTEKKDAAEEVILLLFYEFLLCQSAPLPSLNLLSGPRGYLIKEYINAITAYGPGLGVYTPYQYVDVSYNNLPFVGKVPLLGKEGTSSRLGISPFYPPQGNPSNPFPPLYRARPLPLHVPEPQDVVAVPLDEEALHGEPLFPPELVLPGEVPAVAPGEEKSANEPENPFAADFEPKGSFVEWPTESGENSPLITDNVSEQNRLAEELKKHSPRRDGEQPTPKRIKRIF